MKPMLAKDFFNLKVGDKVHIKWNKDDNPRTTTKINCVLTIAEIRNDGTRYLSDGKYTEYDVDIRFSTRDDNILDDRRGYAYAFYPNNNIRGK